MTFSLPLPKINHYTMNLCAYESLEDKNVGGMPFLRNTREVEMKDTVLWAASDECNKKASELRTSTASCISSNQQ